MTPENNANPSEASQGNVALPKGIQDDASTKKTIALASRKYIRSKGSSLFADEESLRTGAIPSGIVEGFHGSLGSFIDQNPKLFGVTNSSDISDEQKNKYIVELKKKTNIFEQDLKDSYGWKKEQKNALVQGVLDTIEEHFEVTDGSQCKTYLKTQNNQQLQDYLENPEHLRKHLEYQTKKDIKSKSPTQLQETLYTLSEGVYGDDPEAKYAYEKLKNFTDPNTQTLDPEVFKILFKKNLLSEKQVKTLLAWILPTISLEKIQFADIALSDLKTGDLEKDKLKEYILSQEKIATSTLPFEVQKSLLRNFGSAKMVEEIHKLLDGNNGLDHASFIKKYREDHNFDIQGFKYRKKDGFRDELQKWNDHNNKDQVKNIENLKDGNVIERSVIGPPPKNEEMTGYYKIVSFPDGFTAPKEGEDIEKEPQGSQVYLQYIGNNREGVIQHGASIQGMSHEDFFHFLTVKYGHGKTQGVQFIDKQDWRTSLDTGEVAVRHDDEYLGLSDTSFLKKFGEILGKEDLSEKGLQVGSTFCWSTGDKKQYMTVTQYDHDNATITVDDGESPAIPYSFDEFIAIVDTLKKSGSSFSYIQDQKISVQDFIDTLQKNESTSKYFQNVVFEDGKLKRGSGKDAKELEILQTIGSKTNTKGQSDDIRIYSIDAGGYVTYSRGEFTQSIHDEKKKTLSDPTWKGSKPATVHISTLLGFIEEKKHEPQEVRTQVQEEVWDKERKPTFWGAITSLGQLGAIPYAFKKPFEAWKEDREMMLEVQGNQAALLFVQNLPGLRDMDWAHTMVGNTSRNIKSTVDKIAENIGECYSAKRQELIAQYCNRYDHPHPKFLGAMMATLAEYGNLYYGANTKNIEPWMWYKKVRGLKTQNDIVNDTFTQQQAKRLYYGGADFKEQPNLSWEKLQEVNEIEMLSKAFTSSDKRYPQYSNFYRMFDKYKGKSMEHSSEGGKGNMAAKNDTERHRWMMEQVQGGRITEFLGALEVFFVEEHYPAKFKLGPVMALFLSGRLMKSPQQVINKMKDMLKDESILIPAFAFLDKGDDMHLFRNSTVEMAYMIGESEGKQLAEIVEAFDEGKNDIEGTLAKFTIFWDTNGQSMIDLMSSTRDPSAFLCANGEGDEKTPKNVPEKYAGNMEKYHDKLEEKADEKETMQFRHQGSQYSADSFRLNDEFGFAFGMLQTPYYYGDKNMEGAFLNGTDSKKGDGTFSQITKFIDRIPEFAERHARRVHGSADEKYVRKYALMLYDQIRDGKYCKHEPKAGLRQYFKDSFKQSPHVTYWTRPAFIYGLVGGSEQHELNESNVLEKIRDWKGKETEYDRLESEWSKGETTKKTKETTVENFDSILKGEDPTKVVLKEEDKEIPGPSKTDSRSISQHLFNAIAKYKYGEEALYDFSKSEDDIEKERLLTQAQS